VSVLPKSRVASEHQAVVWSASQPLLAPRTHYICLISTASCPFLALYSNGMPADPLWLPVWCPLPLPPPFLSLPLVSSSRAYAGLAPTCFPPRPHSPPPLTPPVPLSIPSVLISVCSIPSHTPLPSRFTPTTPFAVTSPRVCFCPCMLRTVPLPLPFRILPLP